MQKRKLWIDQLKGITIILVIIGHLIIDSEIEGECPDPVKWWIYTFHMPLFFFLSGIVFNKFYTVKKLSIKLLSFLAPFIVVGVGYTYFAGYSLHDFVTHKDKFGYWYLMVLSLFYIFHSFMGIPSKLNYKKKYIIGIVALAIFAFIWCITKLSSENQALFCSYHLYFNWPFFVTGYFLHNHIRFVKNKTIILPISLIVYIASAVIFSQTQFLGTLTYYLRGMGMIIFLTSLFYENKTIENCFIGKKLAYIGTKTLDIYIYHYFVKNVITLSLFGTWVCEDRYYIPVIIMSVVLAVLISYISIYIGKGVSLVPILRNIVYGKKF